MVLNTNIPKTAKKKGLTNAFAFSVWLHYRITSRQILERNIAPAIEIFCRESGVKPKTAQKYFQQLISEGLISVRKTDIGKGPEDTYFLPRLYFIGKSNRPLDKQVENECFGPRALRPFNFRMELSDNPTYKEIKTELLKIAVRALKAATVYRNAKGFSSSFKCLTTPRGKGRKNFNVFPTQRYLVKNLGLSPNKTTELRNEWNKTQEVIKGEVSPVYKTGEGFKFDLWREFGTSHLPNNYFYHNKKKNFVFMVEGDFWNFAGYTKKVVDELNRISDLMVRIEPFRKPFKKAIRNLKKIYYAIYRSLKTGIDVIRINKEDCSLNEVNLYRLFYNSVFSNVSF